MQKHISRPSHHAQASRSLQEVRRPELCPAYTTLHTYYIVCIFPQACLVDPPQPIMTYHAPGLAQFPPSRYSSEV